LGPLSTRAHSSKSRPHALPDNQSYLNCNVPRKAPTTDCVPMDGCPGIAAGAGADITVGGNQLSPSYTLLGPSRTLAHINSVGVTNEVELTGRRMGPRTSGRAPRPGHAALLGMFRSIRPGVAGSRLVALSCGDAGADILVCLACRPRLIPDGRFPRRPKTVIRLRPPNAPQNPEMHAS
jgi:hypothetical protein